MRDLIFEIITIISTVINVYFVILVYRLTQKDINPKLYVQPEILDAQHRYDKGVNAELDEIDYEQKGFPEIGHDTKLWQLKVVNIGDLPATNVKGEYSLTIKIARFDFGTDRADVINEKFVDYKTIVKKFQYDYIAPDSEKILDIAYLKGEFPYADLKINKLISNERKFLNKKILLETYEHPEFKTLQDSHHIRQMLGAYK